MRFSIRSLLLTTAAVAVAWLPTAALMGWITDPNKRGHFLIGLGRTYKFSAGWNFQGMQREWNRAVGGNYADDYISGHIFGWTSIALILWAVALFVQWSYLLFAQSYAYDEIEGAVRPSRRRERARRLRERAERRANRNDHPPPSDGS